MNGRFPSWEIFPCWDGCSNPKVNRLKRRISISFLTPVVVKSTQEAEELYKKKADHIENIRIKIENKADSIKLYPQDEGPLPNVDMETNAPKDDPLSHSQ